MLILQMLRAWGLKSKSLGARFCGFGFGVWRLEIRVFSARLRHHRLEFRHYIGFKTGGNDVSNILAVQGIQIWSSAFGLNSGTGNHTLNPKP